MAKRKAAPSSGHVQLPLFLPDSSWQPLPPSEWPDFRSHAKIIGVDTETHDPNLQAMGPGFIRKDAHVCGVSLAAEDGTKIYLPMRHSEDNVDPAQALAYVRHQLAGAQPKCGANLMYDLEALWSEDITINGDLCDIQIAEPMLDEDRKDGYSLEALGRSYLGMGKTESLLDEAANAFGVSSKGGMSVLPGRFVGPYAEDDAFLPIRIFELQQKAMHEDDVYRIFEVEQRLQKVLFKMRLRGVRIDVDRASQLSASIQVEEQALVKRINEMSPRFRINPDSSDDIGKALRDLGIYAPQTAAGNWSIQNEWLQEQPHEICKLLVEARKMRKMRADFIDKLRDDSVDGRIYSNWQQLRDVDENGKSKGTRSGRIAASKFNLTQVPSRDPRWGKLIRSLFIADEGLEWCKCDYSQQEPRIQLHFAYLRGFKGAAEARQRYIDDPATDYHQMVADLVKERTGKDIGRRNAKDINLGSAYGMGRYKLADKLGVTLEAADEILRAYHGGVPYTKELAEDMTRWAQKRGFIRTILGRRRRFNEWEPGWFNHGERAVKSEAEAREKWGSNIQRAYCHKALNGSVQGSAADQIKVAIIQLDDAGLCPQVQVYDEINGSYGDRQQMKQVAEIMSNAIPMEVPFLVEPEVGPSWGETKEITA
jgi:DNA polymerase I-like protein with 3'-5' exonuclease and polymerase domains